MEQLNVPEEQKIPIDFEDSALAESVRVFRPLVFTQDDIVWVVLGPNQQDGVTGSGTTVEEALKDWEISLKDRVQYNKEEDSIAQYVLETLKASVNKVW